MDNKKLSCHSLVGGSLKMYQPDDGDGLRVNIDTVLLADFTRPKQKEKIIELGCAHGAISLILAKRGCNVCGIDIQPHLIELAEKNAELNGLNVKFDTADLRNVKQISEAQKYDRVVVNPPYEEKGCCTQSPRKATSTALQGSCCTLEDVIIAAHYLLKNKGKLDIIIRADRIGELFFLLGKYKTPPKVVRCVHPKPGREASVVMTEAIRSGNVGLKFLPPLYILKDDGMETEELKKAYIIEGND